MPEHKGGVDVKVDQTPMVIEREQRVNLREGPEKGRLGIQSVEIDVHEISMSGSLGGDVTGDIIRWTTWCPGKYLPGPASSLTHSYRRTSRVRRVE
jgi:hypothetical protein